MSGAAARGDDGEGGEHEHAHADHRVGGPLVAVHDVLGEQRHQRGGEDAAEHQLVDHVRDVVGGVVGVGQDGVDHADEQRHPDQAGDRATPGCRRRRRRWPAGVRIAGGVLGDRFLHGRHRTLGVVTDPGIHGLAARAKAAVRPLASASTAAKDAALHAAADLLLERATDVLDANAVDCAGPRTAARRPR